MIELLVRLQNTIATRDERGAAMAEYGLLLSFVLLVVIAILTVFGQTIADTFSFATDTFNNSPGGTGGGTGTGTGTGTN